MRTRRRSATTTISFVVSPNEFHIDGPDAMSSQPTPDPDVQIACPGCGAELRVPAELATRRIQCPACYHVFHEIQTEQPITAQVVDAAPSPLALQWRMRTPEMIDYGPVSQETLERWVREGRVTGECELSPHGETRWRRADAIFPVLDERRSRLGESWLAEAAPVRSQARDLGVRGVASPMGRAETSMVHPLAVPTSGQAVFSPPRPIGQGPEPPTQVEPLAANRGPLILALGLLGLAAPCPIFSILAWVMGSSDLEEISRGRMDPAGLRLTKAGKLLGMLLSIAWITAAAAITIWVIYVAAR
jgi:hypothetical protein